MTMEAKIRPWLLWTLIGIIIIGGGFTYWYLSKNKTGTATITTSPTPTLSAAKKSPLASPSATADVTGWKTFNSSLVNLSFKYPPESNYQEKDWNINAQPFQQLKGKEIYFNDANKKYPSLKTITSDFSIIDTIPHNIISGTMDSKDSFKGIDYYDERYQKIIEKGDGIYQVIGYANIECSTWTESYLIVKPPLNSGLKYISFYLGNGQEFTKEDNTQDVCEIKPASIEKRIEDIQNDEISEISDNLQKALLIAETFNVAR